MNFKFICNEQRLEGLIKELPELKVIEKKKLPELKVIEKEYNADYDTYEVTFECPWYYDTGIIAQMFFRAGLSWGLDLKYSSYDNEPARVR